MREQGLVEEGDWLDRCYEEAGVKVAAVDGEVVWEYRLLITKLGEISSSQVDTWIGFGREEPELVMFRELLLDKDFLKSKIVVEDGTEAGRVIEAGDLYDCMIYGVSVYRLRRNEPMVGGGKIEWVD